MIAISDLPALNATLNAVSAIFLTAGYVLIRRGHRTLHKKCMLAALVSSTAFLTSYVIYHANTVINFLPDNVAKHAPFFV